MKTYFSKTVLLLSLSFAISCSNSNDKTTTIHGNIKGLSETWVKLRKWTFEVPLFEVIDSFYVKNDDFKFDIEVDGGLCVDFYFEKQAKASRFIFIENGENIDINGNLNVEIFQMPEMVVDLKVKGAKSHIELLERQRELEENEFNLATAKEIIASHPSSMLTPAFILNFKTNESYFDSLSDDVKQSYYGKQVAKKLAIINKTSGGKKMIDFTCQDHNNQPITLSEIKSKYVILDFWASWCKPCRKGHPDLIKIYKKYHDEGLEIVCIASDDENPEAWHHAIKTDNIGIWKHVLNNCNSKEIGNDYNISFIPIKIVIDSTGTILKRFEGGEEESEFKEYIDKLFTEN